MVYVVRRLLFLIPTLFGLLLGVFLLLHIAPGDPVELMVDVQVANISQEQLDIIRRDLGLDRPLYVQFLDYAAHAAVGDLGYSYRSKLPVTQHVLDNIGPTLQLASAGMLLAVVIGIPAGIVSALKRDSWADYTALTVSMIGLSAPSFWLGMLLLYVFAYRLEWFPLIGDGAGEDPLTVLWYLVLPAVVIGAQSAALIARLTRSAMLEVGSEDYVRTAYSKGLTSRVVVLRHMLRNAAVPVIAAMGTNFAYLVTGSVIVEAVFTRHGLGWLVVGAINNRDFPMVQGLVLAFGTLIVLVSVASDLLITVVDPRVSYG